MRYIRTILVPILTLVQFARTLPAAGETASFGGFDLVHLYHASPHPSQVVLFVSGDGGWNSGVVDMARQLATLDTLVVGIDINRLSSDSRARIQLVAFLGLGKTVDFEFHLTDCLTDGASSTSLPVHPEVEKLKGMQILCFYGTEDENALCPSLDLGLAKSIPLQTGHRFGRDFKPIVDAILEAAAPGHPQR